MKRNTARILVVADEPPLGSDIRAALQREDYLIDIANDGATARKRIDDQHYQLVVTDLRMPQFDGLELLRKAREKSRDTQFIVMTTVDALDLAMQAMKEDVYDYLVKPIDIKRLCLLAPKALELQAVVAENAALRQRLQQQTEPSLILGEADAIRRVVRIAEEVAPSDVPVLIEGESGTGRELVARHVHAKSARAAKPFVSVHCAAMTEPRGEAKVCGHAADALTTGMADQPDRFPAADGGTLFLDEVGNLGPKGQEDLLRVLTADVRIIVATNQNLQEAVNEQRFRKDLFERLQLARVPVPALREHAQDIPLLVESFLRHFGEKHQRPEKTFSAEALQLCQSYKWPGNVRQLRNVVERLVLICAKPVIEPADLLDLVQTQDPAGASFAIRVGMTVAEAEKQLIQLTLAHRPSNREAAARTLGVSRRTLQYKLKHYGLLPR